MEGGVSLDTECLGEVKEDQSFGNVLSVFIQGNKDGKKWKTV